MLVSADLFFHAFFVRRANLAFSWEMGWNKARVTNLDLHHTLGWTMGLLLLSPLALPSLSMEEPWDSLNSSDMIYCLIKSMSSEVFQSRSTTSFSAAESVWPCCCWDGFKNTEDTNGLLGGRHWLTIMTDPSADRPAMEWSVMAMNSPRLFLPPAPPLLDTITSRSQHSSIRPPKIPIPPGHW